MALDAAVLALLAQELKNELLDAKIAEMHWESIHAPILAKFEPEASVLEECRNAGADLARKALELAAASGYEPLCID